MKLLPVFTAFVAAIATAQPPPLDKPAGVSEPARGRVELRTGAGTAITRAPVRKPVSGAIVEAVRHRKPLQMISPLAQPEFGNGYANVSVDPFTGQAQGIKLFVIRF